MVVAVTARYEAFLAHAKLTLLHRILLREVALHQDLAVLVGLGAQFDLATIAAGVVLLAQVGRQLRLTLIPVQDCSLRCHINCFYLL